MGNSASDVGLAIRDAEDLAASAAVTTEGSVTLDPFGEVGATVHDRADPPVAAAAPRSLEARGTRVRVLVGDSLVADVSTLLVPRLEEPPLVVHRVPELRMHGEPMAVDARKRMEGMGAGAGGEDVSAQMERFGLVRSERHGGERASGKNHQTLPDPAKE
jgi:hypothetical protein